jgi:hypothetical protein
MPLRVNPTVSTKKRSIQRDGSFYMKESMVSWTCIYSLGI